MAIQKDYIHKTPNGDTTVKDAYWVVSKIAGEDKGGLLVSVNIKRDKESSEVIGLLSFTFSPDVSGSSYRIQAYEYMMSLDKFKDAKAV